VTYERPEPYEVFTHPGGRILSIGGKPVAGTQAPMPATREPVATRSAATVPSRLPDPRAVEGAVVLDVANRTVTVVPTETGYNAMLWRTGVEKLERGGYGAPSVWAHGLGHQQIAAGQPQNGALVFRLHKGDAAWSDLVGTAGLAATVVLDRESQTIMNVRFKSRKRG
jgi:hypothetical protein